MNKGQIVIYAAENGHSVIDVNLNNDTVWLSLEQLTQLFQRDKSVISRHIGNIYGEEELDREATVAFFAPVQTPAS